jgi:hypothetical protein
MRSLMDRAAGERSREIAMLIKIRRNLPREFVTRVYESAHGLFVPGQDIVPKHRNIVAVVGHAWGEKEVFLGSNIVTNDGDLHYAQRAVSETLTNAFGEHELATAAATGHPAKTSVRSNLTTVAATQKATDTGYPTRNDSDGDNTGAGVDIVTHRVSYTVGDFSQSGITHGCITNNTPATAEVLLTAYAFGASFNKTSSDTLKVFVNHEMLGS